MRIAVIAGVGSLILVFAAHAEGLNGGANADAACASTTMTAHKIAYSLPQGPECCGQQLRCTQFLSTTTIERLRIAHRT